MLTWLGSVGSSHSCFRWSQSSIYVVLKVKETGAIPTEFQIDWLMALLTIAFTFPAHLADASSLLAGHHQSWTTTIRGVDRLGLASAVPMDPRRRPSPFSCSGSRSLLRSSSPIVRPIWRSCSGWARSIRYLVAALAVLTAPLVEELVYRGISLRGYRTTLWRCRLGSSSSLPSLPLFTFRNTGAASPRSAPFSTLSLVLTLLRAFTGRILPCIATHLVYNGIQAVGLLFGDKSMFEAPPPRLLLCSLNQPCYEPA
jgi:membrane protease YdiL (CAAX protease family)